MQSPTDGLTDDDDDDDNLRQRRLIISQVDNQTSPRSDQTMNRSISLSPSQTIVNNGIDDMMANQTAVKLEHDNELNCSSPSSPSIQPLTSKVAVTASLPISSSNPSKRSLNTLNRLLNSIVNRPNGHHYHQNGLTSSASTSSSLATTTLVDSSAKEPKASLETSTQSIESTEYQLISLSFVRSILFYLAFVQHFDSAFNTMTYFQEKLQQLLLSVARTCY